MKANTLIKKDLNLEELYKQIKVYNEEGRFKLFIFHDKVVSKRNILELKANGYKVYKGEWDAVFNNVWIIEW